MREKILLHTCCAPCSTVPIPALKDEGFDVVAFFFNPNIHPYSEFMTRLKTMQQFIMNKDITGLFYGGYPLKSFLKMQLSQSESRCAGCYELRLTATAERARREGIGLFSTTLLVSPYQKHDLLADTARAVSEASGVEFVYRDWRPRWRETRSIAREEGLYMQRYCGCIFSEAERYLEKERKRKGDPRT